MASLLLGFDIGTTATKGLVLDPQRGVLAAGSAAVTLHTPRAGWAEEDPEEWWGNLQRLATELLGGAGVSASSVRAVGLSGMVPALLCLDEAGRPLRRSIQQNDARAVPEIAESGKVLPAADLLRRTGSPLSQQSIGPKLLWLRRHEPEVIARTAHICGSYDFIRRRLTGDQVLEANWALESGLYDLSTRDWAPDLGAAFGVDHSWLGPVRSSAAVVGQVSAAALPQLAGAVVVAGCADHVAGAFAAGLTTPGEVVVELGGSGNVLAMVPRPLTDPRLYLDFHLIPGAFVLNGCMATTGSLVRWFSRELAPGVPLEALDAEADAAGLGAGGLVALPYYLGEKTPLNDPLARGVFAGLHLGHTRGHLFRAILEGIAFAIRHHVDVLAELGVGPSRVRLTGGGARSSLWRQILADVLDLPVQHVEGASPALGAAYAAGVGAGLVSGWEGIAGFTRVADTTEPVAVRAARYQELYAIYRSLYPATADQQHALARFSLAAGG